MFFHSCHQLSSFSFIGLTLKQKRKSRTVDMKIQRRLFVLFTIVIFCDRKNCDVIYIIIKLRMIFIVIAFTSRKTRAMIFLIQLKNTPIENTKEISTAAVISRTKCRRIDTISAAVKELFLLRFFIA